MKTTHAQYGEAMGILAGDGLLNYAFETAARAFELEPGNGQTGKALAVLAQKAGIRYAQPIPRQILYSSNASSSPCSFSSSIFFST